MNERHCYLELSQESGSHKFYEVTVQEAELSIRYGRIGDAGQRSVKTLDSSEKALAEAVKKVNEKTRSGYQEAVQGERQKRTVARRTVTASASELRAAGNTRAAPVLWKFDSGSAAFGICVTGQRIWVGNEAGDVYALTVYALTLSGEVEAHYKLPGGVKCIIEDGDFLYAGCDNGKVYDLNSKVPRVAYEISDTVSIYWLDISDALLAISDDASGLTLVDHNDEFVWSVHSGGHSGWMVRADQRRVCHGTSAGVTAYDTASGQQTWQSSVSGVLFGWQTGEYVYPGTASKAVHVLDKQTGREGPSAAATRACPATRPQTTASTSLPPTAFRPFTVSRPAANACGNWRRAAAAP
jgi:predicted DNA-binding WGR domain protein